MTLIDTALDRSIVLGYGRTGLWARRHLPGWPADPPRLDGKVALVTGAASGLGLATCTGFARLGARVLAVGRNQARAEDAARDIRSAVPGADVRPLACDVSSLSALRRLAEAVDREERQLDVLVNNAGVMPANRQRSDDGHELTFATHVLGPFALVFWTRALLERSAPARVITVSSGGMYTRSAPCDDPESERQPYWAKGFYATTKREQVLISDHPPAASGSGNTANRSWRASSARCFGKTATLGDKIPANQGFTTLVDCLSGAARRTDR